VVGPGRGAAPRRPFGPPGLTTNIERGVVHDVIASSPVPSVSVHVYSPPLTAMGYFDDAGSALLDRQVVDTGGGAIAPGRALHPSAQ
jgi:hypothetical protein